MVNVKEDSHKKSTDLEENSNTESEIKNGKPFISKQWWKSSGTKTMGALGKLSKSFLLPIALLPIAGLFIGIGSAITQIPNASNGVLMFGTLMSQMGSIVFGNLSVLFLISAIIAYTNDSGSAVIAGIIAFLVFNVMIAVLSTVNTSHYEYAYTVTETNGMKVSGVFIDDIGIPLPPSTPIIDYVWSNIPNSNLDKSTLVVNKITSIPNTYNLLFWKNTPASLYDELLGVNTLNTGVFSGIIVGCLVAYVYNRTYKVTLPSVINFFSGIKFVPIVMFFAIIPLALLFMILWPLIGQGLNWVGQNSGKLPYGLDSAIFELFERSLVPFGLHHVFYSPLWWTQAGGGPLSEIYNKNPDAFINNGIQYGLLSPQLVTSVGDQTMSYAVIDQSTLGGKGSYMTFDQVMAVGGPNLGRFQSGKFGFMMFGLPAAAIAMWLVVPKENRKGVMGIYFSAGITSFLTGITEPIEYTFLFVVPWLFYGVHMPLAVLSFWALGGWHTHVANSVSGGFIDMIIFGVLPAKFGTNWWHIFVVGPPLSVLYFILFYWLIKIKKAKIPGLDGAVQSLYTKQDFKENKATKVKGGKQAKLIQKASTILENIGGIKNIEAIDACASRLRINLHDLKLVQKEPLKATGTPAVIIAGTQLQLIYGGESDVLKSVIKDIMSGKVQPMYSNAYNESLVKENKESLAK